MRNGERWTNYGLVAVGGLGGVAVYYGMRMLSDVIAGAIARSQNQGGTR